MATWRGDAFAKVNFTLDVLGVRPDAYHDLRMIMQTVSLCDRVVLRTGQPGPLSAVTNLSYLPAGRGNIAYTAAEAFFARLGQCADGVSIEIEKRIPVAAGLAGGSADAAAVLRGLNELYGLPLSEETLLDAALSVGSDLPFCLRGGTKLAEGRGEWLTELPLLPPCFIVLCKPPCSVSTAQVFAAFGNHRPSGRPDTEGALRALRDGDLKAFAQRMYNVLEPCSPTGARERAEISRALIDRGALGAVMSGSGPTMLGLFDREDAARDAYETLRRQYKDTFLTTPVREI